MSCYPVRRSTRLQNYNYAEAGAYFVTLCLEQRMPLLGEVVGAEVQLSPAGKMVDAIWQNLETFYCGVSLDAHVTMPNHFHGILVLDEDVRGVDGSSPRGRITVSAVAGRFKSYTAHLYGTGVAARGWPPYPGRLWQRGFHDRIIRNERELEAIREYILYNPLRWHLDRENPDGQHGR
ncbi:MAG TPA: transposase [Chloroflexota bacterium]|nr:transposase [Chloroflexota bacterium]